MGTRIKPPLKLNDGSRVAVMGGGPAGSFFAYFLLDMASRAGLDLQVDLYEPRDFSIPGPPGCNMCGGIVSESLVQMLAAEGIHLPASVVQRGIEAYVLHTDVGSVRIGTPLHEKRIGAVFRGPGPKGLKDRKWGSFDGHLQTLAISKGARVLRQRVEGVSRQDGKVTLQTRLGVAPAYDLLAVTVGVNTAALRLFQNLDIGYRPPRTTKTFIREYYLGQEAISQQLGSAMHVFLLNLPRLEFAAIIPKGDYVSVCLLGEEIDDELLKAFLEAPEVKERFQAVVRPELLTCAACQCAPRINVEGAGQPYADRMVFIGDCGVTRLYKDGIGAAYRAAKAAATTAIFEGVAAEDFRRHYLPACRAIADDNAIGKMIFAFTREIQKRGFTRRAVVRMVASEQARDDGPRRMSTVLWDMFTGSAPYREILMRALQPGFWLRFGRDLFVSLLGVSPHAHTGHPGTREGQLNMGALGKLYQPGEVLIRQGATSEGMLVILEGQVAMIREQGGQEVFLGVRSAGEVLGEMAMLEKEAQTATARSLTQVRVLTVDKANFTRRIHQDPSLAYRLFQLMSRRLRELSQEVALLNQELDRLTEESRITEAETFTAPAAET